MDRAIRVGLVGYGAVARVHLEVYENLTGIKVVAITDSNPIKVAEASREFQLPGFSTVEEMLESTELDIACIVTPPAEHEEPVFRCAASGVH